MTGMYELKDVSRLYRQGGATIRAVDGVNLLIAPGDFLVIEGRSGSGKSTLLQLLGGLDVPTSGHVLFDSRDMARMSDRELTDLRSKSLGFVFQHFNLIPTLSAQENVEAALAPRGMKGTGRSTKARSLLEEVGLADRSRHLPSQLSGGEQQRVAIARALANEPRVILADEPTGNLDSKTGEEIISLLAELSRMHNTTVVLVTHDQAVAAHAPRVLRMNDGRLAENGAAPAA
jgi:putative ABC transport system ATP-binding protein